MTQNELSHIWIDDTKASKGARSASIDIPGRARQELRFEYLDGALDPAAGADAFVLGSMLLLMEAGFPVHVHGSMSSRCLWNISELQHIWARWKPASYKRVEITADVLNHGFPEEGPALAAFSGGVDACFTVQRHLKPGTLMASKLEAALFVQGFDIPEHDDALFSLARKRGEAILSRTPIRSLGLRTNFKALGQDWQDSHGLGIAACLSLFQTTYSLALIGSGSPYEALRLGWGSSPISDHLFSTGRMEIRHDGAGASRTEKVAAIVAWPEVARGVRVCWEGADYGQNCGQCEKCVRTYLNFRAAGIERPECFESYPSSRAIRWTRAATPPRFYGIKEILEYAESRGCQGQWVADLRFAVRLNRAKLLVKRMPLVDQLLSPLKKSLMAIVSR
ncbi:hypothetical protein [Pseudarthrobacter enclensis]|uniref:hypothetical protein n=1 Tax=Pseudarthrobacter enclensis TaxID=993070 RepID=UPI003EE34777